MSDALLDLEALLSPIPGAAATGADSRFLPVADRIKAARRQAEQKPNEPAGWALVADLSAEAIRTESKDLQFAVWLLEALARVEGFRGAAAALALIRRLLERYWESLFPRLDPEDDEPLGFRSGVLEWIDERLPGVLKGVPLTGPPAAYTLLHYEVTQKSGDEKKALLEDGWPDSQQFEDAMQASSPAFLESVLSAVEQCQAEIDQLERVTDAQFVHRTTTSGGDRMEPLLSFRRVRELLATAAWLVERQAKRKRGAEAGTVDGSATGGPSGHPLPGGPLAGAVFDEGGGDSIWTSAVESAKSGRLDALQLLQQAVAGATCGRARFIRQLQLAELCASLGLPTLAYPMFDELARTVETRTLEDWEPRVLVLRTWQGLESCCTQLLPGAPALQERAQHASEQVARLSGLTTGPTTGPQE